MQTRLFQGDIGSTDVGDLLLSLQAASKTGRLRLQREGIDRDLYIKSGYLAGADSSSQDDSLEWLLLGIGTLTEERHAEVRGLIAGGMRRGRALVETGSLSPQALVEWTEYRARYLARDVLAWKSGTYQFEEGAAPPAGLIEVRVSPAELLLGALRQGAAAATLSARLPSPDLVLEPAFPAAAAPAPSGANGAPATPAREFLLPHELYVLSLADGRRKVSEICFLSEIGEAETLRCLALLSLSRCARAVGVAAAAVPRQDAPETTSAIGPDLPLPVDLPAGDSTAEMRAVVRVYNDLYAFVYAHMIKEVGPIAEQLLDKNLRDVRDLHAALFNRAPGGRDGCLPEDTLMRNVNLIKDQNRRELLVTGMHDYLKAMVLAVRRILGPGHEGQVVRRLRDLRCSRT